MKFKKIDYALILIFLTIGGYFITTKFVLKKDDDKTINSSILTRLSISPDTLIDLGVLKRDVKNNLSFTIKNEGEDKLYIRDFSTTCGCTSVGSTKNDINSNDSCILKATIDTEGKIGKNVSVIRFKANTKEKFHRIYLKYSIGA